MRRVFFLGGGEVEGGCLWIVFVFVEKGRKVWLG